MNSGANQEIASGQTTRINYGIWGSPARRKNDSVWPLRAFNNWAKRILIKNACRCLQGTLRSTGNVVVDLKCQQGGDQYKWYHEGVDTVHFIEDDAECMRECKRRFQILQQKPQCYEAVFHQEDFTEPMNTRTDFADLVSSQLCINEAFQSQQKVENMAKNVKNMLKEGGIFVMSNTSSKQILKAFQELHNAETNRNKFGNDIFQIEFTNADFEPNQFDVTQKFGISFNFKLGNQTYREFLIPHETLVNVLQNHDLHLISRETFTQMFENLRQNPVEVAQMKKMKILRQGNNAENILSDQERLAASLYEGLIFKKISNLNATSNI